MLVTVFPLIIAVLIIAISTAYVLYTIRQQRCEDRRFYEAMKHRINVIATY